MDMQEIKGGSEVVLGLNAAVDELKRGRPFSAVNLLAAMPRTATTYFYLIRCYRSLSDLPSIFRLIREFSSESIALPLGVPSRAEPSPVERLNAKSAIDKLEEIYRWKHPGIKANIQALESFVWINYLLIASYGELPPGDRRILANAVNLLAESYAHLGKHRAALDMYHVAALLFTDSVYSSIAHSELAYTTRQVQLCMVHLRHANHLIFYSGNRAGYVYNPYFNAVDVIDGAAFLRFAKLSAKCGFSFG